MIRARDFVERARHLGYGWYAGVPCSFLTPFIDYVIDDPHLTYVSSANEGDAVAAAAGTFLGGVPAVAMLQNSGLGNAVNPLASLTHPFRIPVLLVITWRGEPERGDEPQHALMGRATGALLDLLAIPWEVFPTDPAQVAPALGRAHEHLRAEGRPYAFVMRKGSVAPYAPSAPAAAYRATARRAAVQRYAGARRPSRGEALERVLARTGEGRTVIVATTGYTGRQLYALADRPNHLYMVGSMGCASALGLGLAMTRPDLRVVVIDGDGAALMRMGNLATAGAYAGGNLVHLLFDNEAHESTGGQATVSPGVDFAEMAAACGYARVAGGESLALVDALLDDPASADAAGGPAFGHLKIRPGTPSGLPRPSVGPEAVRRRLMAHIGSAAVHAERAATPGPRA